MSDDLIDLIGAELEMATRMVSVAAYIDAHSGGGWGEESSAHLADMLRTASAYAAFPPSPWAIDMIAKE